MTHATFQKVLHSLKSVLNGTANWTSLIPNEWIDQALNTPGSAYVIAFVYWLRHPVLLCFLLPTLLIIFLYCTVLVIHLCRLRYWLVRQYNRWWPSPVHTDRRHSYVSLCRADFASLAQLAKRVIAAIWDAHGRIFHAYEVVGMDRLPAAGPAFVVYYHGTCPFDAYYLLSRYCIEHDRFPIAVVDRFLFRLPGMKYVLDLVGAIEGTVEQCAAYLNPSMRDERTAMRLNDDNPNGCVLLLAPGGVREALFADESYCTIWGKRNGFAKVALLAKQPIYPMFTENIRESIRVVQMGKSWWCRLYERTRLPFALFYGYFPVKLRTYIGEPIYPLEGETPEELAERTRMAIDQMISEYQWTPANLFCALLQRIPAFDRWLERRKRQRQIDVDS
ncbi:hypothetical protein CRM22_006998 [Opisthorchis felineus]|uniref:Phospholipid/glycerol acyltransferase domain-containing protein n=1 Tax=Opisthorchis felineus TaxID=147828 RepID=A0A4S2LR72_OPIFE|nr:hypothetical protein CRM22_006998 [Opisthorchis felineus]